MKLCQVTEGILLCQVTEGILQHDFISNKAQSICVTFSGFMPQESLKFVKEKHWRILELFKQLSMGYHINLLAPEFYI